MLEVVIYLAGLCQGWVIACIWIAPDTPFWRGFRSVWSLGIAGRRALSEHDPN